MFFFSFVLDPSQISELLSKTISDAHARTCLYSLEHIHEMFRKPQDLSRLLYYKNMAHEELWLECAQKLTTIIQQIIEFAKMVPGFMKLSQDDQIVLLKAGKRILIMRLSKTNFVLNYRKFRTGNNKNVAIFRSLPKLRFIWGNNATAGCLLHIGHFGNETSY